MRTTRGGGSLTVGVLTHLQMCKTVYSHSTLHTPNLIRCASVADITVDLLINDIFLKRWQLNDINESQKLVGIVNDLHLGCDSKLYGVPRPINLHFEMAFKVSGSQVPLVHPETAIELGSHGQLISIIFVNMK